MPQHTYTCPCGDRQTLSGPVRLRRRWGTMAYAPWWQHTCPACDRRNTVHDGEVLLSIQGGKPMPVPATATWDVCPPLHNPASRLRITET